MTIVNILEKITISRGPTLGGLHKSTSESYHSKNIICTMLAIGFQPGPRLNIKTVFPGIGISMLKIRQLQDCLIFNMGIPILVKQHLYIEMAPRMWLCSSWIHNGGSGSFQEAWEFIILQSKPFIVHNDMNRVSLLRIWIIQGFVSVIKLLVTMSLSIIIFPFTWLHIHVLA